jgi:hypothetical protein
METKIRKQIYLDPLQNELLKQTSQRLGVSEAEIIRQAIVAQTWRLRATRKSLAAWNNERQFLQNLLDQGRATGSRTWKREELYER